MNNTCIAIFCFNRPDALARLLESLANCKEFAALPLYFYIDKARSKDEEGIVSETSALAEAFRHPMKTIVRRETNLGLKVSLTKGISEILVRHKAIIVLEDDLVLGPFALDYFLCGLEKYAVNTQVISICGYATFNPDIQSKNEAYFLPMTHPWGWATWDDRWHAHMKGTAGKASINSRSFRMAMNVFGLRNFRSMLKLSESGIINSWWIYWQLNAVNRHAISLFPWQSHVKNIGLTVGTHASKWNLLNNALPNKVLANSSTSLPDEVLLDFEELDQIIASREAFIFRIIGFLGTIKRTIRRNMRWL